MVVVFSEHALRRLAERKLRPSWVEAAVMEPDWIEPDPNDPSLMRAYKVLSQLDGRILRVVYLQTNGDVLVITAFPDRDATAPR